MTPLRVGTRGSALALVQARWVAERLAGAEIVEITTSGDQARGVGDKSRWVDTIEAALVAGEIDLAVHSAKDVPGELARGLRAGGDPAARGGADDVADWERGATGRRVGTSSLRRRAQLLSVRPDLEVVELRGNVDTRLRKLDAGEVDAIVLAAAGLERLGRGAGRRGARLRARARAGHAGARDRGRTIERARACDRVACMTRPPSRLCARNGPPCVYWKPVVTPLWESTRKTARFAGFVGLPDGSAWVADEVAGEDGEELARRMLAAGAGELLAQAEAMA